MDHASWSIKPWKQFTTGVPAALKPLRGEDTIASALAKLLGCEDAVLAPSTLHLFWDIFAVLADRGTSIFVDGGSYPISRWGIERALAYGIPVKNFRHNDVESLKSELYNDISRLSIPLVVTDGLCPDCGGISPLADYVDLARKFGGYVIIDDTQALGILGNTPEPKFPYGRNGGGSLKWHDINGPNMIVISSLAKSFGVPLAVLAGSNHIIQKFKAKSKTRVHCSPPSIAVLHAAEHALKVNTERGDSLRKRLFRLIRVFRQQLKKLGLYASGGVFPVQTIKTAARVKSQMLHARLLSFGVKCIYYSGFNGHDTGVSLLITARHKLKDIDRLLNALASAMSTKPLRQRFVGA